MPRLALAVLILLSGLTLSAAPSHASPIAHAAAVCADYPNQAAAQAAADTRDADGDGIYCESLPCPCSTGTPAPPPPPPVAPPPAPAPAPVPAPVPTPAPQPEPSPAPTLEPGDAADPVGCTTPTGVQNISFSKTKYPTIRRHFLAALRKGWPRTLVVNRTGSDERRNRLLKGFPTRAGKDRDEYPPAIGRGRGAGLTKGSAPRGWRADVAYVPSSENRSHGATMGTKLRRFCSGTRFRYVFY